MAAKIAAVDSTKLYEILNELMPLDRQTIDQAFKQAVNQADVLHIPVEDRVRVLRLYAFEGPRKKIEEQINRSISGTRTFGPRDAEVTIYAATIGSFPDIIPPISTVGVESLGPHRVYNGPEEDIVARYDAAVAAGATHITVPPHLQKPTFLVQLLEEYRQTYSYMWPKEPVEVPPPPAPESVTDPRD